MNFCKCVTTLFLFQLVSVTSARNILLIIVDDLRTALGCYGDKNAYTPNIDALAEDGIVFKRAYAQQALCAPSRNSLLTSRRPDTLHLYDFYSYWRESAGNFTTLPQFFKENGYITKSIGKIFHPGISSNFNDDQPYSWTEAPYHPPTEKFKNYPVCWNVSTVTYKKNLICPIDPVKQPGGTLPDLQSLYEAKSFLKSVHFMSKPFFLAVGFHKPHVPLKYPKRFLEFHPIENVSLPKNSYKSYGLPNVAWNPWTDLRERDDIANLNLTFPFERIPDDWAKLIIQSYYAAVSYIDELVGQLMESLLEENLLQDTIVVLTADHGWSLGEHSEWSKFSNFEVAVNVPLILSTPQYRKSKPYGKKKVNSYKISNALVELVDLFPTLVELVGLERLPKCLHVSQDIKLCTEGLSLKPLIDNLYGRGEQKEWKTGVFSQYPRPGPYPTNKPNSDKPRLKNIKIMGYSIRTEYFRYTEWVRFKSLAPDWSIVYAAELYDHTIDPGENLNLADRSALESVRKYLSEQLRGGWRFSLPKIMSL